MNLNTIYRKQNNGFTSVSHKISRNKTLSVSAIGIMTKLLGNSEKYIIHKEVEQKQSRLGKKNFNKAWDELVKNGFIIARKYQKNHVQWQYIVINDPDHPDNADLKNPSMVTDGDESSDTTVEVDEQYSVELVDPALPDKIYETSDTTVEVEEYRLPGNIGKVADNINRNKIEVSKKEEKKIERINREETITANVDGTLSDLKVNPEIKIEETIDDILFTVMDRETFKNTSTVFDSVSYQVEKVRDTKQVDDTILTLSNFCHDTSIQSIDLSQFDESILQRKNIFLSYWYNTIDASPISSYTLQKFNDTYYFKCFNWIFRKCLMEKNLHLQPYRFFDVSIDEMMLFIEMIHLTLVEENTDRNVLHTDVAKGVLEKLRCDKMKLSQYINDLTMV
jgi:hypothetical protein